MKNIIFNRYEDAKIANTEITSYYINFTSIFTYKIRNDGRQHCSSLPNKSSSPAILPIPLTKGSMIVDHPLIEIETTRPTPERNNRDLEAPGPTSARCLFSP